MTDDQNTEKVVPFLDPKNIKPGERFFEVRRPSVRECTHRLRGFELDPTSRTVSCRCGVVVDPFDALMFYASQEQSIAWAEQARKDAERKAQEDKEKRLFVMPVTGYSGPDRSSHYAKISLKCGHTQLWTKRRMPKEARCEECWRRSKIQEVDR